MLGLSVGRAQRQECCSKGFLRQQSELDGTSESPSYMSS